jgi:tetratricopeptide (TPR) repeat protein
MTTKKKVVTKAASPARAVKSVTGKKAKGGAATSQVTPAPAKKAAATKAAATNKDVKTKDVKTKDVTKKDAKARTPAAPKSASRSDAGKKSPRKSAFSNAVKLYENGFKLMHAEKYDKARDTFTTLVNEFPDETELLDRAHVLIHVCQKRLRESKNGPKLKSADDYYEIGVAEMNRRELDDALEHLQQALKMSPRADHVLYALAAVSALRDERDEALEFLQQSIKFREENRFLAINDVDFESLSDDPEFIQLISPDEG